MNVIALALSLMLQGSPPPPETKPDFAAELKALEAEYTKAQQEYGAAIRAAKTAEERTAAYEKNPAKPFLPRFKDLAERAKGTDAAPGALARVYQLAAQTQDAASAREAAQTLLASHPQSGQLATVASGLQSAHYYGWTWAKEWLRACATKAEAREAKAAALLSLAVTICGESNATDEERREAKAALEALIKDYADTAQGKRAEPVLFEVTRLQIGMEAPDFESTDVDGKAFKLSDYRGKVVVVDFWGFW